MINTKLIFVDGITGSGKSTTAHFIARQLEKNGIKAKWFYECEDIHPLRFVNVETSDENKFAEEYLERYLDLWRNFSDEIHDDNKIYVIECHLFQAVLHACIWHDYNRDKITEFYEKLFRCIAKLNPVAIHYYQDDVERAIRENWQRRGDEWKNRFNGTFESPFCRKRELKGDQAEIELWKEISRVSRELFTSFTFPKIEIENSAHEWELYKNKILDFLNIEHITEETAVSTFKEYCGNYAGVKITHNYDRLCINWFLPDIQLIKTDNDAFVLENFPVTIKFLRNEKNEVVSFEVYKALCDVKEGYVLTKQTVNLSKSQLQTFCGDYWCEADNLDRKIYLKEDNLYYACGNSSDSKLIPIALNQLLVENGSTTLNFSFNSPVKSFVLSDAVSARYNWESIFVQKSCPSN